MFVLVQAHITIGGLAGFVGWTPIETVFSVFFLWGLYFLLTVKDEKKNLHVVRNNPHLWLCPFFVTFSYSLELRIFDNHAHWDACSWKMLSLHKTSPYCQPCKSPHTQRKFKYLFIFRANETHSQLQNCPVQTRQRRHIQCKSFPCWLGDLCCYEYECYITIMAGPVSRNCLLWLECKKEKSVWLWTFSRDLGSVSQTESELGICDVMDCRVGWEKAKQKRDQVPPSNKKKAAKTAITHKMKFALQFSALHSCCGFIATQTNL